jgi:PAS domain S-box-containing protein
MGIITKEKETKWININTRPLFREGQLKPYAVAISFSDITGRKQAETQIENLAQIADVAPSSITVHDFEGNMLYANERTYKMHNYSKDEFMKIKLDQLDVPESSALIDTRIKEIKEKGEAEFEVSHYREGGSAFPLQVYVKQIEWFGQPALLSVASDISARKQAKADLLKLNKALEIQVQERAVVDSFTFSVSHDLRAPLRRISGFSEILLEEYAHHLDSTGQDYLNRINKQAVAMDALVEALIRLSSITQLKIEAETVNLSTIADSYIDHLRLKEPERRVLVSIEPDLYARGDPELLRLVVAELIHNSWKFTKTNKQALIKMGANEEGDQPVYYVRDNGSGFNMQYADKLFEPFKTLHQDEDFTGVGVGLNIAQRIIIRHGGKIYAEGVEGKGATIYFTLL